MYLGDGCLLKHPRDVYRLHIVLDTAYPVIAGECEAAMSLVMPASKASCQRHARYNMFNVVSYSKHWPHLFPQHGPGPKHKHRIRHPKKTYVYPRYLFTNRSLEIQGVFCDSCDRLGIDWRQDGPWNISVARREAVAIMDRHVGPKR